jgi:hypothetical protein
VAAATAQGCAGAGGAPAAAGGGHRRAQDGGEERAENEALLAAFAAADGSVCALADALLTTPSPPPPPPPPPPPCEDDADWTDSVYGVGGCDGITANGYEQYCSRLRDASGVPAMEACPIACGTGDVTSCAEYDNCWDQRDTCADCIDGLGTFTCERCAPGFCGTTCEITSGVAGPGPVAGSCECAPGFIGLTRCDPICNDPTTCTFPGSQILSAAQQVTLSGWAPQGPTQQWALCFSSFTDDASDPSVFHSQCDEYDVTMVVASNLLGYTFGGYVRSPLLHFCLVSAFSVSFIAARVDRVGRRIRQKAEDRTDREKTCAGLGVRGEG